MAIERKRPRRVIFGLGPATAVALRLPPTAAAAFFAAFTLGACAPASYPVLKTEAPAARVAQAPASPPSESGAPTVAVEGAERVLSPHDANTAPEGSPSITAKGSLEADTVPGWLGISMRQTDEGVVVANVLRGSPAAAAGLQAGDRLLRIGPRAVAVTSDVSSFVQEQTVGARVNLDVRRGKSTRLLYATIAAKPEREAAMRAELVGREAPSISRLETVQGSVVPSWNQLRGQVVVLYFWASWCVACRALSPTLNVWHQELAASGVNILGITMDPFEVATQASRDLEFPTYVDATSDITTSYQGTALPTLIVVDKSSVVRDVMAGLNFERLTELRRLVQQLSTEPTTP